LYAINVLKGRFPMGEPRMKQCHTNHWLKYYEETMCRHYPGQMRQSPSQGLGC
jgi:hypothetical protein